MTDLPTLPSGCRLLKEDVTPGIVWMPCGVTVALWEDGGVTIHKHGDEDDMPPHIDELLAVLNHLAALARREQPTADPDE